MKYIVWVALNKHNDSAVTYFGIAETLWKSNVYKKIAKKRILVRFYSQLVALDGLGVRN